MKKKRNRRSRTKMRVPGKIFLIMKLTFLLMLAGMIQLSASVYSQNSKLSLDLKNCTVKEVLQRIEEQSEFRFFYNEKFIDLNRKVTVSSKDEPVGDILNEVFEGAGISYKVMANNLIIITPTEGSSPGKEAQAQAQTIFGKVTDSSGAPLPGVTIVVKGSTKGTITDSDGQYSLTGVPGNATLLFSFVGMKTKEIPVSGKQQIDVAMEEEAVGLEEVVAIGYGTANRQDYPGSVSSVKVENSPIALTSNLNVLESLKGNVSGLNIGVTNTAGGQPDMLIRGQNSINGSNAPLIILDGVIYMGSLSDINPNDIASFDILKDAVSAAAYGSRAANGVIAIKTKKGSSAKPLVTFNTSAGIQSWQGRPKMMKGEEWIKVVNDRNLYPEGSTDWMQKVELENLEAGKEINWLDEATRTGIVQDYQLSVSGAGKGINYYLSAAYNANRGVVVGDDFERISVLGKINTDITEWLKIGVDASFSRRDYSGFAASLQEAQKMSPYGNMYRDSIGNLEKYPRTQQAYINPLWGVNDGTRDNKDIDQNFRLNSYAVIEVPWIKGLSYRINFLTNLERNQTGNFSYESYYVAAGESANRYGPEALQGLLTKANGNMDNSKTYSYVIDNIVNYKNQFGRHSIEGTFVATRDYSKYEDVNTTGSDFSDNGNTLLGMWGLHKATVQKVDMDAEKRTNVGYLGRISYSFNGKYYLTGSFRRDGASVFGENNKWGNFAAAGIAWKLSEENFMKSIKPLNYLKLKFSWGQNGNQGIDPYTTLSQVSNGSAGRTRYEFSNEEGTVYYGLYQSTFGNSDLGWESTESINTGFESIWLSHRLFVDADLYFSKTTDQIFTRNIPVMNGFQTITTSMGQVNNTGIELTVKSVNVQTRNLNWTTSVTFWKNNNKLKKLYGEDKNGDGKEDNDISNSLFIGKSLGAIYGYEQDGIVQEEDTEYMDLTEASAGDPKYKDLDGVQGINDDDRKILGYGKPNFKLNFSSTLDYKNFEFYIMLAGTFGGHHRYLSSNTPAYMTSGTGRFSDNMPSKPYWTPENRSNVYPSATFSGDGRFQGLQSRGFVRIQDITLSYLFKQPWVEKVNINSLRVFCAAKNVATFTNWDGGDPESGAKYLSNKFPIVSTYSIGVNISF